MIKRAYSLIIILLTLTMLATAVSGCMTQSPATGTAAPSATPSANATSISTSIAIFGNVSKPMNLSVADLQKYPQVSLSLNYSAHHEAAHMEATGVSLNDLLNATQPYDDVTTVVFKGADGYSVSVPISTIRKDNQSILAINSPPDGSLRDILPSQYYAQDWTYDLVSIEVQ